jgi:hypothetical protein
MMEFFPISTLKSLITHHIALIDRTDAYDISQEFALLFLKMDEFDNLEIKKSIQIIFRDSDIIFNIGPNYIILLPKTNWNGAKEVIDGLEDFLDQKLEDSIVTYPDDGKNAEDILDSFKAIVKKCDRIDLEF